ncbi:MAG TPA: Ig-like domain-containing protein [Candidatus Limnocylindria bacterium]
MRAVLLRYWLVVAIGLVVLGGILYYASTVDGRPPVVQGIALTLHTSEDERLALTTSAIEVEFSEPVQPETAEAAFRLAPAVPGEFSWSGAVMRFTPQQRLPLETEFSVRIEAGVTDPAGNRMAEPAAPFEFRTVGPPRVEETQPADGATGVPLDAEIVIRFNTLMDTASVEEVLRIRPSIAFDPSWSAESLTLVPRGALRDGTHYVISISADARDSAGNPMADAFSFAFESAPAPIEPAVLVPAPGAEGVAPMTPIAIFFDREIDSGTDVDDLFSIEPEVAGTLEVVAAPGAGGLRDPTTRILRFEPSAALAPSTTYHLALAPGLVAADGSQLAEAVEWSFTTGSPLGSLGNQVVFLSERSGVANLWAMNPDGSGQRQVTAELSGVTDYAVAPDGRRLLVGDGAVLVVMNADGSGRQVLTDAEVLEFDPAWSPDGTRFAFGRAGAETAAGLGLWTRAADGGDEQRVDPPGELSPGSTPTAEPSEEAGEPVLRTPRWSPDGGALAYVDVTGRVGVVELPASRHTTARMVAVGAPVWLADSTGMLVTRLGEGALQPPAAGAPLPPLDPEALGLGAEQLDGLQLVRLDRGSTSPVTLGLPPGAWRPAIGDGRLLYIRDDRAILSDDAVDPGPGSPLLEDADVPVRWAVFGLDERTALVARAAGGVWVVDVVTGRAEQLTGDGWQPSWLP